MPNHVMGSGFLGSKTPVTNRTAHAMPIPATRPSTIPSPNVSVPLAWPSMATAIEGEEARDQGAYVVGRAGSLPFRHLPADRPLPRLPEGRRGEPESP